MKRGSKKHQRMMESGTDTHHFWWPKKLYSKNRLIEMSYAVHHIYHSFFMARCKLPENRQCFTHFCKYQEICCYCRTHTDYGRRIENA